MPEKKKLKLPMSMQYYEEHPWEIPDTPVGIHKGIRPLSSKAMSLDIKPPSETLAESTTRKNREYYKPGFLGRRKLGEYPRYNKLPELTLFDGPSIPSKSYERDKSERDERTKFNRELTPSYVPLTENPNPYGLNPTRMMSPEIRQVPESGRARYIGKLADENIHRKDMRDTEVSEARRPGNWMDAWEDENTRYPEPNMNPENSMTEINNPRYSRMVKRRMDLNEAGDPALVAWDYLNE